MIRRTRTTTTTQQALVVAVTTYHPVKDKMTKGTTKSVQQAIAGMKRPPDVLTGNGKDSDSKKSATSKVARVSEATTTGSTNVSCARSSSPKLLQGKGSTSNRTSTSSHTTAGKKGKGSTRGTTHLRAVGTASTPSSSTSVRRSPTNSNAPSHNNAPPHNKTPQTITSITQTPQSSQQLMLTSPTPSIPRAIGTRGIDETSHITEDNPLTTTALYEPDLDEKDSNDKRKKQLKEYVRNNLFPFWKFFSNKKQMIFTNHPGGIVVKICNALHVRQHQRFTWWEMHKKSILMALNRKRNDVTAYLKKHFCGKQ